MLISKLYNILSLKNTKKAVFKNDFMHGGAVGSIVTTQQEGRGFEVGHQLGIN